MSDLTNLLPIDGDTSLDIVSIKDNVKSYLTTSGIIKDIDYESSNISILVNIISYAIYNINANGALRTKDSMLVTSDIRENIINIAKQLSYSITRSISSKLNVTLSYNLVVGQSITIPRNTRFNVGDYVFVTQEDLLLTEAENSVITDLIEGVYITSEQDSRLSFSITDEVRSILIPYKDIENDNITVTMTRNGATIYPERVNSYLDLDGTNYVEIYDVDTGYVELVFSYMNLGGYLQAGDVLEVEILLTNGSLANNINSCTQKDTILDNDDLEVDLIIAINSPSRSGQDEESNDSIKANAPLAYNTGNRVVNDYDHNSFLVQSSLVEKANTWGFEGMPDEYWVAGTGHVTAIPQDVNAKYFNDLEITELLSLLSSKRIISTYKKFFQPQYIYLDIDIKIIGRVYNLANKQDLVEEKFNEVYNDYLSDFNSYLYYSKIVRELESVFIEDNATVKITLKPYFMLESENFDYGIVNSDSRVLMFIPDSEKKRYLEKDGIRIDYPDSIYEANDLLTNGWIELIDNQEEYDIDFTYNDASILSGTDVVLDGSTVGSWNKDDAYIDFDITYEANIVDKKIYINYNDLMNVKYVNNTYIKKGDITYV